VKIPGVVGLGSPRGAETDGKRAEAGAACGGSPPRRVAQRAEKLEALCASHTTRFKITPAPYWTAEIYGFGKYIRKYAYFPSWLPLCINTDHGPGEILQIISELKTPAPAQLFHSPSSVKVWKAVSRRPAFCFHSPFVFGRKVQHIERASDSEGTIAFPAHTTVHLRDEANVDVYIAQLKALPSEFQPVGICLHATDIGKSLHIPFLEQGFDVFTAGHMYDDRFSDRFYEIIRRYKYATSNYVGSYAFYCIEMGIPFFVHGQAPEYVNLDDPTVPLGNFSPYDRFASHRRAHDMFATIRTTITEEQREFAETHLGIRDGLGRLHLAAILWYALIRRCFTRESASFVVRNARARLARSKL
jgi:hypothetical protein